MCALVEGVLSWILIVYDYNLVITSFSSHLLISDFCFEPHPLLGMGGPALIRTVLQALGTAKQNNRADQSITAQPDKMIYYVLPFWRQQLCANLSLSWERPCLRPHPFWHCLPCTSRHANHPFSYMTLLPVTPVFLKKRFMQSYHAPQRQGGRHLLLGLRLIALISTSNLPAPPGPLHTSWAIASPWTPQI